MNMNPFKINTKGDEETEGNIISFIASDFIDGNTDIDEAHLKELLPILPCEIPLFSPVVRSPFL